MKWTIYKGSATPVGYVIDNAKHANLTFYLAEERLVWPTDYVERNITPKHEYMTYGGLPQYYEWFVGIICIISIIIALTCMIFLCKYRQRPIIMRHRTILTIVNNLLFFLDGASICW